MPLIPQGKPDVATFTDGTTGHVYSFPFNINQMSWNYQLNTQSFSTLGGRVTQILSVNITTMEVAGEAGNRKNLIDLYTNFRTIQENQNINKKPVQFNVPSKNLHFSVWLENFQFGWDVNTVAYPYVITLQVVQSAQAVTNASTKDALNYIFNNNKNNIGFDSAWTGMSSTLVNITYSDIAYVLNSNNTINTTTG